MLKSLLVIVGLFFSSVSASLAEEGFWDGIFNQLGKEVVKEMADNMRKKRQRIEDYRSSQTPSPQTSPAPAPIQQQTEDEGSGDPTLDEEIVDVVSSHFDADSKCSVDISMRFYNSDVFYDGKKISKDRLKEVKQGYCKRLSGGSYVIKDDNVRVSKIVNVNGYSFKNVSYIVSYSVYSKSKNQVVSGQTKVNLTLDAESPHLIVVEEHEKLTN